MLLIVMVLLEPTAVLIMPLKFNCSIPVLYSGCYFMSRLAAFNNFP